MSRIGLVKPQKARQITDLLIRMAQSGQIRGQVTEDQLIGLLDQVDQANADSGAGKITVRRSRKKLPELCTLKRILTLLALPLTSFLVRLTFVVGRLSSQGRRRCRTTTTVTSICNALYLGQWKRFSHALICISEPMISQTHCTNSRRHSQVGLRDLSRSTRPHVSSEYGFILSLGLNTCRVALKERR